MQCAQVCRYVKSAGGIEPLIDVKGGGQEKKVRGGAYQITQGFARRVGDARIRLNSPVRRIEQDADGATVTTAAGETLRAKRVIVATPPHLSAVLQFEPPLPLKRLRLLQHSLPGWTVVRLALC